MATKDRKAKSFAAFASANPPTTNSSNQCKSCREPWRGLIRDTLNEIVEEDIRGVSLPYLRRFLVEEHGYEYSQSALRKHMADHEAELYERFRAQTR